MEANIDPTFDLRGMASHPWVRSTHLANRSSGFGATLARAKRAGQAKRAQRTLSAVPAAPLDGPPADVQREMAAAARLWQTLAAQGKELRFERTADGRVSVELIDISGRALDVIGPSGLFRLLQQAD